LLADQPGDLRAARAGLAADGDARGRVERPFLRAQGGVPLQAGQGFDVTIRRHTDHDFLPPDAAGFGAVDATSAERVIRKSGAHAKKGVPWRREPGQRAEWGTFAVRIRHDGALESA